MPKPVSFWDRPDVNSFLPGFEVGEGGQLRRMPEPWDDEPSQEDFEGRPDLWQRGGRYAGSPALVSSGRPVSWEYGTNPQGLFLPPSGPSPMTRLADFLARRGKRPAPPTRQAGPLAYMGRVLAGPGGNVAQQAQAVEGR